MQSQVLEVTHLQKIDLYFAGMHINSKKSKLLLCYWTKDIIIA